MVARFVMKFKKQRIISIIAVVTMAIVLSCAFIACDKVGSQKPSKTNSENVDQKVMIKSIQNGKVDGLTLSLEIDNTVEDVDLSGMITTSKDCSWQLYTSKIATSADAIVTKMIVPKNGNNTYYIVVTSADEKTNRTYTLNVWKNYYATLSFYANGSFYTSEHVLTHTTYGSGPSCSVAGYTFNGWGCDGYYVTESKSFNANLTPLTYSAKFDSNGGSTVSDKTATFNKDLSLPSPYKTGYTFLGWYLNDNLYKDSIKYTFTNDVTFTARWQLNYYKVIIKSENEICGTVNAYNGSKNYGNPVPLTATTNPGYIFIGWFANGTKISSELSINVNVPDYDVTYTAKWNAVDENIRNYKLRQTADGYIITDVIDKTVSKVIIPDVVVGIDNGAFSACTKIKTIIGNATNVSTVAIQAKPSSFSVNITSGTSIGYDAFYGCTGLTGITIPNSVTSIGSEAFYGCKGLMSITLPDSVTSIGSSAFEGCTGLTSITVADGNTKYHSSGNCLIETTSKTLILGCNTSVIPSDGSITSIGSYAFKGCTGLTNVTIPDSVTSIGSGSFYNCSGLTSITIPDSVTSIDWLAFYECSGLTSVTIGTNVTSIGSEAFYGCKGLMSITLPDSVTSIGSSVFKNCTGLTNVTIPNNVTSIGSEAFYGCRGLTNITIPDGVTSIGQRAFYGCTGLTSITIPSIVTSIGSSAFSSCTGLASIIVEDGNANYHSSGNCLIETESKKLIAGCNNSVIPNDGSVTSIGSGAFVGCTGLTNITIPDSVTSIGYEAFKGCAGLTSVTIPNSVTSIDNAAFQGCTELTSITIPDSVTSIGDWSFYYCPRLTSVTIGICVTNIGDSAFAYCTSLSKVIIGNKVTNIRSKAFRGCTSLTNIIFNGTIAQWKAISKSYDWKYKVPATEVVCTDGTVSI